jgi:predicted transcriptional regulator
MTAEVIEDLKEFWLIHDVTPIPPYLMLRIGELKGSNLIKTATSELGKVHQNFLQVLSTSKTVRGTSPIFHPDYVHVFKQLLSQGSTVDLILTRSVLEKTLASAESELSKNT